MEHLGQAQWRLQCHTQRAAIGFQDNLTFEISSGSQKKACAMLNS
jgi:hypothetical protein